MLLKHGAVGLQRDPLRTFYESLHEQLPESEMAEIWYVTYKASSSCAPFNGTFINFLKNSF